MDNKASKGEVLLYSKETNFARLCGKLSHEMGFNLNVSMNLIDFLIRVVENGFDLAIFDFKMAGNVAIKWIKLIRIIRPKIQLIIYTNPADREIETAIYEMGVFYLGHHPVAPKIMKEVITAALNYCHN